MNKSLLICLGSALLCFFQASLGAELPARSPVPLTGKWVLCQDQDNGPKDVLQFFPEGYGFSLRREKPKVPFLYKVVDNEVLLAINAKNLLTVYLQLNKEQTKLTLKSERTGHVAFYVRGGSEAKFGCTAK